MAKFEQTILNEPIQPIKKCIKENLHKLGKTVSLEEEIEGELEGVKYCMLTLERFSNLSQNRCALNILLLEYSQGVKILATAAGGSNAMFMKVNHWSEDNFLSAFVMVMENYKSPVQTKHNAIAPSGKVSGKRS